MRRRYDHIDLRVHSLAEARPFYQAILPALGFTRNVGVEGWLQFEAIGTDGATEFFWCHRVVAAYRQRVPDRLLGG